AALVVLAQPSLRTLLSPLRLTHPPVMAWDLRRCPEPLGPGHLLVLPVGLDPEVDSQGSISVVHKVHTRSPLALGRQPAHTLLSILTSGRVTVLLLLVHLIAVLPRPHSLPPDRTPLLPVRLMDFILVTLRILLPSFQPVSEVLQ